MRQRFHGALSLLRQDAIEPLIQHFLALHHCRQRISALIVAMYDSGEQRLNCYHYPDPHQQPQLQLDTGIEDINHPLIQVLRNGQPRVWHTLNQGVRIENDALRQFIQQQPKACGLFGLPLFDFQHRACGVIAVFAENISRIADVNGMFALYCEVFQHQLSRLQEMAHLKAQSGQIHNLLKAQQLREKQLGQLLETLTTSNTHSLAGLPHDYSQIDDLTGTLATWECAVLRQRHQQYAGDLPRVAGSLGIPLRALKYKLAKYRSQL
ncbi:Fis family transcriptional regulator [Erwiniaceae bacterium CAU 1747]